MRIAQVLSEILPKTFWSLFFRTHCRNKKNLPPSSLGLKLINSLLWRALQQKLYRQDVQDFNHLKRILLHCWILRLMRGARLTAKRVTMVFMVHSRHVALL